MKQNVEPRQKSRSSHLLTQEENDQVFQLLGRKCQSMCTSVAQIFKTDASAHSHWKKKYTGVLCFIKDSSKRSYYIRVFCLIKNELVWEHEMYDAIKLNKTRPYLIVFEGQDGHVALNFASEDECKEFYRVSEATVENRNRKRQERRNRPKSQLAPAVPSQNNENEDTSRVTLRNHPKIATMQITPANTTTAATTLPSKSPFSLSVGLKDKNKKKKKGYTKADISTPTNFIHISHVGWDATKGFDLTGNDDDEMLKHFFNKAGVSEQQLNDRDTRAFIYDFIQSNNVLDSVKKETSKPEAPTPPPVPSRNNQNQNGSQRTAPPPPPFRQPPPPLPVTTPPVVRGPPPSRPPPIVTNNTSIPAPAPPPPPPPQPQISVVAPPPPPMPQLISPPEVVETKHIASSSPNDPRSALMDSIRKGTHLKKIDQSALSTGSGGDSRSDLMSEIRQGIELRPASTRELAPASNRGSDSGGGTDALADALRRALLERGRAIHSSDDDTGESSGNDDDWDD